MRTQKPENQKIRKPQIFHWEIRKIYGWRNFTSFLRFTNFEVSYSLAHFRKSQIQPLPKVVSTKADIRRKPLKTTKLSAE